MSARILSYRASKIKLYEGEHLQTKFQVQLNCDVWFFVEEKSTQKITKNLKFSQFLLAVGRKMNSENSTSLSRTLILVKPDGVQRGLIGEIISRFERVGLKIIGMKLMQINAEFSKRHYREHINKGFYPALERFITQGPVVALVLEGIAAVEIGRKIVGATEPKSAQAGTIRGDFTHQSYEYSDAKGIAISNLVHASGNEADAKYEISLWFSEDELFNYNSVHEKFIF